MDFNSRTSTEPDYLDYDKYLEDEDDLANISDFRFKKSKDHVLDAHGKRLLSTPGVDYIVIGFATMQLGLNV